MTGDDVDFGGELFIEVQPKKRAKQKRWPTTAVAHITTPTKQRTVAEAVAAGTNIMGACGRNGFPVQPLPESFVVCLDCQRAIREGHPA